MATDPVIRQYEAFLSWFACDRVAHEYIKSQSIIMSHVTSLPDNKFQIGTKLVSSSLYSCAMYCNFLLPCRHILFACKALGLQLFDVSLCREWWCTNNVAFSGVEQTSDSCVISETWVVQHTRAQHYNAAMKVFGSMAAIVADLPEQHFSNCMLWVSRMEQCLHDGRWEESVLEDRNPVQLVTDNAPASPPAAYCACIR